MDIGFGGILHMPQNNKVCRKFSVRLLSHIDISRRSIVINKDTVIPITDVEIQRVLGILRGNRKLVCLGKDPSEKNRFH